VDQICSHFPDEWVVLVEADWANDQRVELGTAVVIGHYKRRKEASPHIVFADRLLLDRSAPGTGPSVYHPVKVTRRAPTRY
jgi:hypothetical protein